VVLKHDNIKVCYFIKSFLNGAIPPNFNIYYACFTKKKKTYNIQEILVPSLQLFCQMSIRFRQNVECCKIVNDK